MIDWRATLASLTPQFQALAANATGLNHMLVEVADNERLKMGGPPWFEPFTRDIPIVQGMPQYGPWDCSKTHTMPSVPPGFREVAVDEELEDEKAEDVIRDGTGLARAVAVPMKLRTGYFCGRPSPDVAKFESLANVAASALVGATDLEQHFLSAELIDLFRKPFGGVRYVFGEIYDAPSQFVARGWAAGVLQYPKGILIDMPISESAPDSNHWVLLLHRLGWRRVAGSGLGADRRAWSGNMEVDASNWNSSFEHLPPGPIRDALSISHDSFYSVLGTKDAPLDLNVASVLAIQLLLASMESSESADVREPENGLTPAKVEESPKLKSLSIQDARMLTNSRVGLVVATETERQSVLSRLRPLRAQRKIIQVFDRNNTYFIGRLGLHDVIVCMSAMGSVGRDASHSTTSELIDAWKLSAVIMPGIAFGADASKQQIGTVLVSDRVIDYESQRLGVNNDADRGQHPLAGSILLNRFRNAIGWNIRSPTGEKCSFQVGPILSGEKLLDSPDKKQELLSRFPTAIGGEMEGAGVAAAAGRKKCEWILVKSICDWGDGTKTKKYQAFAASTSISLVEHVLNQPGALDDI